MMFAIGRHLRRETVRRLAGRRLNELSRRLGERGLLAIIFVRVVPVGPFSIVNIVAGASHIRWRDFLLGTLIGLLPGVMAASIFVDRVAAAIREPGTGTFALVAAAAALLIALVWTITRRLRTRAEARREPVPKCMAAEPAMLPMAGSPAATGTKLRVGTWNIHGAVGADRRYAPSRIVGVLSELDADVVALQEVPHNNFLSHLEHATGYHVAAGPLFQRRGTEFGNAVLSRRAFDRVAHVDLTVHSYEPRGALDVRIDVGAQGPLRVLATHLGLRPGERREQVKRLLAAVEVEGPQPTILMGDLNEWYLWGRPLRWLHAHFREKPGAPPYVSGTASRVRAGQDLDLACRLPSPAASPRESAGAGRIGPSPAPRRGCRLTHQSRRLT
jgi:endonuclease/exonuclease/phosphatase family metal-dependent hydrolase